MISETSAQYHLTPPPSVSHTARSLPMPSATLMSTIGALQASVSVLITLSYGVIAARLGMVHSGTARDVASLCRNVFLPALLITEIGAQLNSQNALDYAPIFVWSIGYATLSIFMGKTAVKVFGLPSWTIAAITFNNTTSLPLLLTRSLLETGILSEIAGGDTEKAVARARSYFLVNSLVSKVLTFAVGPSLLGDEVLLPPARPAEFSSDSDESTEPDEETGLIRKHIAPHFQTIRAQTAKMVKRTPRRTQNLFHQSREFFNPTTLGGILAIVIGVVPSLHHAAFAPSNEGGFLNAWLISSLRNVGALFSGMEFFIVGSKLSDSFEALPDNQPSPKPPKGAVATVIIARFFIWAAISIPLVYFLATRTRLLGGDSILWWSLMLMPIGPPGLILGVLLEVTGVEKRSKMMVARVLAYTYMVTPIMTLPIVAALNATKAAAASYQD
ncbi:hypothetical protein NP233_g6307 [Leucocoprinus birnbaumii]|uniref:Auxin efflux carrier n=1 Tax=Leucocoprinus birnbaumii TaxID=56174 RepID=A0AAD5YVW6_9AGAR|nr:hypothetical protein NP233_g6307 [Leucocoprinus birnbaumii]